MLMPETQDISPGTQFQKKEVSYTVETGTQVEEEEWAGCKGAC